jgi:hypothetical protein
MTKTAGKKEKATGWARFGFTKSDLNKLKKARMLSKAVDVVIPDNEIVPCLDIIFRVLFLSLIYRGISLPCP